MDLNSTIEEVPFEILEKWKQKPVKPERRSNRQEPGFKRLNRNCPSEVSSMISVSSYKELSIEGVSKKTRDPRFDVSCGDFNKSRFRKNFSFLYDEELPREADTVKQRLKESKIKEERESLKKELGRIRSQIQDEKERRLQETTSRKLKSQVSKSIKEGKKPFYANKSQKRQMHLIEKYKSLKKDGKLEKFIEKKRRKKLKVLAKKPSKNSDDLATNV